jgi:uncharacterized protein YprB with RNaseH-like and TPR domain
VKVAYLDIETSYLGQLPFPELCRDHRNHRLTVIGILLVDGPRDSFLQLVGEEISQPRLMQALEGVERIVTYNGRSIPDKVKGYIGFDFPVIKAQLGVVLDKLFEHVDLCPLCWKANLWGGLKAVEQALGLKRQLPGKDGAWADLTWKQFEATREARLLEDLLSYNKEDVFMLRRLEEVLAKQAK